MASSFEGRFFDFLLCIPQVFWGNAFLIFVTKVLLWKLPNIFKGTEGRVCYEPITQLLGSGFTPLFSSGIVSFLPPLGRHLSEEMPISLFMSFWKLPCGWMGQAWRKPLSFRRRLMLS